MVRAFVNDGGSYEDIAHVFARVLLSDDWCGGANRVWNLRDFEIAKSICLRPVKFLLMRPWCTYEMSHAILGRFGSELGTTFHGHHDFQLTDDIIHKVHIGHYTFYSKSTLFLACVRSAESHIPELRTFASTT